MRWIGAEEKWQGEAAWLGSLKRIDKMAGNEEGSIGTSPS